MEVLFGPTFSIEVPSTTAFVRPQNGVSLSQDNPAVAPASLFMTGDEKKIQKGVGSGSGEFGSGSSLDEVSSGSSSSIGVPDDDSEDEAGDEVQSKGLGLCSLDSLEDSLPIKKGLSSHFSGKSKSFTNLSEVSQLNDLVKSENPFNKRKRILMAAKRSFYNWSNPKSMPLLTLNEKNEEEDEDDEDDNDDEDRAWNKISHPSCSQSKDEESDEENELRRRAPKLHDRKLSTFKSKSCFDLQEYEQL